MMQKLDNLTLDRAMQATGLNLGNIDAMTPGLLIQFVGQLDHALGDAALADAHGDIRAVMDYALQVYDARVPA